MKVTDGHSNCLEIHSTEWQASRTVNVESVDVSGVQVNLHTGRSLTENTIADAVLIQFDLLMMNTNLLETYRDYNNKLLCNVIVHQFGHLPRVIPGCTVSKTLNCTDFLQYPILLIQVAQNM